MPLEANKIIQGLWIGSELSAMEQLSISSFLQNGHDYHLYVYDEVKNIPPGTLVMDAQEILPSSCIFQYQRSPSYAGFARAVKKFGLERHKKPHRAFCPVDYEEWRKILRPGFDILFDQRTYAIHLWNEMWRAAGQDKNALYHQTCLYEKLKQEYLPVARAVAAGQVLVV